MSATWYDVLDVESTATTDQIRAAWRAAVADLDPTSRRFRLYNEAAEVLLDPARRSSYDDRLALERLAAGSDAVESDRAVEPAEETEKTEPTERTEPVEPVDPVAPADPVDPDRADRGGLPVPPGRLLVAVAVLVAIALTGVGVLLTRPADASVASDTEAAQAAAERAIVPILSYDARHLDRSEAAATRYLTADEKQQYEKLFAVVRQNAPRLGTVIRARYVASGIVRSGTDRVDVLVFVDQVTTNQAHPRTPVVFKNQATVTMARVGGEWLVDAITTSRG